ncbi:hypothetical protein GKE82_18095 [Conexibacter sp. W3-3-2]|uniref:hypothetical protein n=1 Tax=Conexibacter sp. W3-3-2 TaxID=2675227 RepID=UPI0012B78110|nr:hypothetical protein [Conexibacter sp. W3-3-2]MTD46144.1 hypothetical protein [Conexibacter sp. W3-3-2]
MARVEITSPATEHEAAAVVAAVEQYLRDNAPPAAPAPVGLPGWQRAALLEGVGLPAGADHPWLR